MLYKCICQLKKTHSMLSGVPVSTQGLSGIPPLSVKDKAKEKKDQQVYWVSDNSQQPIGFQLVE